MIRFEWDINKALINIQKHGIAFESAAKIFLNYHIIIPSDKNNEKRYIAIGEVNKIIMAVVFTKRKEAIRIISARKARENEKRKYYKLFD